MSDPFQIPSLPVTRRAFLRTSSALASQVLCAGSLFSLGCDTSYYGALGPPDENGVRLPKGFRSRVLAVSGDPIGASGYVWHGAPDGGAVFAADHGWIYVSNSERLFGGGVGALRFAPNGDVVDAYPICTRTRRNCAGGATPWGTWLSCEEVGNGRVFECDPLGRVGAVARPALGLFNHEAVATDPVRRHLYLTEDSPDGRLYRFTPDAWPDLASGVLEVAQVLAAGDVVWHPIPDPTPAPGATPTRRQVPASTPFRGGEGIVYDAGHVYFTTKLDDRVWDLDLEAQTIALVYERATDPIGQLSGVDNIAITPAGDLCVAEDGGNMELVLLQPGGLPALALLRIEGQPGSELAGPAFDPTGTRLYFSSQRGTDGRGITYEVRGPFPSRRRASLRPPPA